MCHWSAMIGFCCFQVPGISAAVFSEWVRIVLDMLSLTSGKFYVPSGASAYRLHLSQNLGRSRNFLSLEWMES